MGGHPAHRRRAPDLRHATALQFQDRSQLQQRRRPDEEGGGETHRRRHACHRGLHGLARAAVTRDPELLFAASPTTWDFTCPPVATCGPYVVGRSPQRSSIGELGPTPPEGFRPRRPSAASMVSRKGDSTMDVYRYVNRSCAVSCDETAPTLIGVTDKIEARL